MAAEEHPVITSNIPAHFLILQDCISVITLNSKTTVPQGPHEGNQATLMTFLLKTDALKASRTPWRAVFLFLSFKWIFPKNNYKGDPKRTASTNSYSLPSKLIPPLFQSSQKKCSDLQEESTFPPTYHM